MPYKNKELQAKYYQQNRKKLDERATKSRENLRLSCLQAYGNCCAVCGESDSIVLVVDHINNDGAEDRRNLGSKKSGHNFYRYLRDNNYPKDKYQLLCCNCNWRKEYKKRKGLINAI